MTNRMLGILLLALLMAAAASAQDDPGIPDTLYVSSVEVNAGETAIVEVNFFSDEELAAITIPLAWSSPDIILDSVSLVGTRIEYIATKPVTIYQDEQTVVFGAIIIMEANIAPGYGLAGTMYFNIPPGTPDQFVTIDSTVRGPAALLFTNLNSSNFTPQYVGGTIKIGDPVLQPHISLSPTAMVFDGTLGYPSPASQALTIENTAGGTLNWTAGTSSTWLSANPPSGVAPSTAGIKAEIAGLTEGTYYDTVVISCPEADNSPQRVPVTFNVTQLPPRIVPDPIEFFVSAVVGGANPDDRILNISTDIPASELNWTVANTESWLTLLPTSGTPPDFVTLSFDITGLGYGYYSDTIVITDPNATNSPRRVPVTLQVVSDLPVMEMPDTLHVAVATGTDADPKSIYLYNSGEGVMTYTVAEASDYILNVVPASGTAPENINFFFETASLSAGQYYESVIISSPEAVNSPRELIVHFYVTSSPPDLYVIPGALTFTYYECWQGVGTNPPVKYFQIQNVGAGVMSWTTSNYSDWLVVQQTSGIGDIVNSVGLNAEGFSVGTYIDTITVTADNALNSPKKIVVTLNVVPGTVTPKVVLDQALTILPAQEEFGVLFGELASVGDVVNQYAGCMDYRIEEDIPWLRFVDTIGMAPHSLEAVLEIGAYTYGIYPDSFLIHSNTASNSPLKVYLDMHVWRQHGDCTWSNLIDVGDVVYLLNYEFKFGPAPKPEPLVGDCNCDFFMDVSDVVIIINYIFKNGDEPCGNP